MSQSEVTRTASIDEPEPAREPDDKKPKSRRPANTAFRQQRLKAWQPILTPKSVLPLFFVVGVVFAPIGGILLWASSQVQEIAIDYSQCGTAAPLVGVGSGIISDHVSATFRTPTTSDPWWERSVDSKTNTTTCHLYFQIPENIGPPVFMYYRLTNFYQNHRRYVQSLDLDQLKGTAVSNSSLSGGTCAPLAIDSATGKAIYPCGLIANSKFNDTIGNPVIAQTNYTYNMTNKGIAWASDKALVKKTQYQPWEVVPPPNWALYNGSYTAGNLPDLHENEEFLVWMRTAGLPSFSKLSRRNDNQVMPKGTYRLDIVDRFPVLEYEGTKSILITTRTVMGGKNPFMGIAYVVIGGVCVLFGVLFTIAHLVRPRKLGDHTYLTWDSNQPNTAVATGRDNRFGSNAP